MEKPIPLINRCILASAIRSMVGMQLTLYVSRPTKAKRSGISVFKIVIYTSSHILLPCLRILCVHAVNFIASTRLSNDKCMANKRKSPVMQNQKKCVDSSHILPFASLFRSSMSMLGIRAAVCCWMCRTRQAHHHHFFAPLTIHNCTSTFCSVTVLLLPLAIACCLYSIRNYMRAARYFSYTIRAYEWNKRRRIMFIVFAENRKFTRSENEKKSCVPCFSITITPHG